MDNIRVRFAPSPTGPLHIGGVRTALFNYLFAKANGGELILRIEDTDSKRFVDGSVDYIIDSLAWLGITFDAGPHIGGPDGPYTQSARGDFYKPIVDKLIADGHAYYAFDTSDDINKMKDGLKANGVKNPSYNYITRNSMKNSLVLPADAVKKMLDDGVPYTVRIKMPRDKTIIMNDMIMGNISVNLNSIDDKVLMKSDGVPTYHLANIVDDHYMKISHVLRGSEWLPSLPLHIHLYDCLGWDAPIFAHLPLIMNPDGKGKLSKRSGKRFGIPVYPMGWIDPDDGITCLGFKDSGFFPSAVVNYLSMLGWNDGTDKDIYTMDDLIDAFSLDRVNKNAIRYDMDKANFTNKSHLGLMNGADVVPVLRGLYGLDDYDDDYIAKVFDIIKSRCTFMPDVMNVGAYFFKDPHGYDDDLVKKYWKDDSAKLMYLIGDALANMSDSDDIDDVIMNAVAPAGVTDRKFMGAVRLALTNFKFGPTIPDLVDILGPVTCANRLLAAANVLGAVKASD